MKTLYNIYKYKQNIKFYKNLHLIFGLGSFLSKELIYRLGVSKKNLFQITNLNLFQIKNLTNFIKDFLILENVAKTFIKMRYMLFLRIKLIKSYKFRWGYPVHGQRTRCNAKTAKRKLKKKK